MGIKQRRVEAYRLTISGLKQGTSYSQLILSARKVLALPDLEYKGGSSKSHVLYDATIANSLLRLRFLSFTTGYRPDVLDTEDFELTETPLGETQTGVEWTHCLGGRQNDRFVLLVERSLGGIRPTTLERYLQAILDETVQREEDDDPVVVTLEMIPGKQFADRLESLTRVKKATYRVVRPNPGWDDLESDLGEASAESDAHKTDIIMTARRGKSLSKKKGIVAAILDRFSKNDLDYARIEGERNGIKDNFDTVKYGVFQWIPMKLDQYGQIDHAHAWRKLAAMFDEVR